MAAAYVERPRSACALSGALAAISTMPDVAPVIHSALGCGGALSGAASFGAGYLGSGYCSGTSAPSSGITEREIVFGGTERLHEQITSTLELIQAELYVVATSCMTEMIGDDVFSVVREFEDDDKPVIAINTPSFAGDSYAGYEILLDGIFNRYLPVSPEKDPALVNLFGLVPAYDPFFRGDLEEIARLLKLLGLRVNTFFTPDQNFDNIRSAPRAALNIVFSHTYGAGFARRFKERHGTPFWVTDLPIGAEAADRFLLELGGRMEIPQELVQGLVDRENLEYYGYFARAADLFSDGDMKYYAVTVTNSNYVIPVSSFIQRELGWVALESFVTDQLKDPQREIIQKAYAQSGLEGELILETDTSRIAKTITRRLPENRGQRYFDDYSPLYILGSSLEKPIALKRGAPTLSISYPVYNRLIMDRGYAGYRGGLHLFEDLIGVIVSPK
jgi:nitrogenase molybdenum-iron protein beta chain